LFWEAKDGKLANFLNNFRNQSHPTTNMNEVCPRCVAILLMQREINMEQYAIEKIHDLEVLVLGG